MKILFKGFVCNGISEPSRQSVLIENGRIAAVEKDIYGSSAADRTIIIKNGIIAPGFIDCHGHSEFSLLDFPSAASKRLQGFTTEIIGNCGLSAFPVTERNREHLAELYKNYHTALSWSILPEYQHLLQERNAQLRIFSLCGHNTLRAAVAGYEKERLSGHELSALGSLLEESLASGAIGMSTGLLYVPGCFSNPAEIIRLMQILAAQNRVYATHLRSEGGELLESLTETFDCALQAGLKRVLISHFKTARPENWHKLDAALELIAHYRQAGLDIHVDRYPYLESQTMLSVILPPPYDTMRDAAITAELLDESVRSHLLAELHRLKTPQDWQRLRLTGAKNREFLPFIGKFFHEIPGDPAENCIKLLAADATSATISATGMSENNLRRIMALDFCMCGSDGYAMSLDDHNTNTHPRSFGSGAKFMRKLLDSNCPIGQAVKRMTALPAEFFRLPSIGMLRPGFQADLTVFDPETIDSDADFISPAHPADGVLMTVVKGELNG